MAASAGKWEFVEKLVGHMHEEALGLKDVFGWTALHYAAAGGELKACKALVRKNPQLTQIMNDDSWTPLMVAARGAPKDKEVVWFLARNTTDVPPAYPFTGPSAGKLVCSLAAAGFHDILLYLIERYHGLATLRDDSGSNLLDTLALRPSDFKSGMNLGSWQKLIYPLIPVELNLQKTSSPSAKLGVLTSTAWYKVSFLNQIGVEKLKHRCAQELVKRIVRELSPLSDDQIYEFFLKSGTMSIAAAYGVVEIVELCLQMIPNVIWFWGSHQPLLCTAVQHRQEKIFNLIYKMDVYNRLISGGTLDVYNNTILHMAAELAPPAHLRVVSGAALKCKGNCSGSRKLRN